MSFFDAIMSRIKDSIPEGQRSGMEDAMSGIAGGAAMAAAAPTVANAITPELAALAKNAASGVEAMHIDSSYLSTPGGGQSQGVAIGKRS